MHFTPGISFTEMVNVHELPVTMLSISVGCASIFGEVTVQGEIKAVRSGKRGN